MSSPAVPEVRAVEAAEEPAATGSAVGAPVAKAAGPSGPPAALVISDEQNVSGRTVTGVLFEGKDLLEIPIEELLALSVSSLEPADSLINDTCYEILKTEAERWHRSADLAQEHVHSIQSVMNQLVEMRATDPAQPLEETRVPTDFEEYGGQSHAELAAKHQGMVVRLQQLRSGGSFWGYVYFSALSALPDTVRQTTLSSTEGLQDLLRWSVGRFSKLSMLFEQLGDYIGRISESEAQMKQHFSATVTQLHDLANGVVGLSSSVRHCQDEMLKTSRATSKSMSDTLWQVSGTGKTVNAPLKEVILGVSKVVSQLDGTATKQAKSLEKITSLLEKLNGSMEALIDVERHKSSLVSQMRSGSVPVPGGGVTNIPPPGPASGPAASSPSNAAPGMAAGAPPATLGTAGLFTPQTPQTPNVQPKLMPSSLTPPAPSALPPPPVFTPPPVFGTGPASAPVVSPSWKRVRVQDGSWNWAEAGQGDI